MSSKRAQLRKLVSEHPEWDYRKYAEELGQNVDTVRGALSSMGMSRKQYKVVLPIKKVEIRAPKKQAAINVKPIFGSSYPKSFGYLKLM